MMAAKEIRGSQRHAGGPPLGYDRIPDQLGLRFRLQALGSARLRVLEPLPLQCQRDWNLHRAAVLGVKEIQGSSGQASRPHGHDRSPYQLGLRFLQRHGLVWLRFLGSLLPQWSYLELLPLASLIRLGYHSPGWELGYLRKRH